MLPVKFWGDKCVEWVCKDCPHREREKNYQALLDWNEKFLAQQEDSPKQFDETFQKHWKELLA
jgi:hypothetical protein